MALEFHQCAVPVDLFIKLWSPARSSFIWHQEADCMLAEDLGVWESFRGNYILQSCPF
jgi:hypothetical protein